MNCKNCNQEVTRNYCQNCGQPTKLKRIDVHYIAYEIEHILHFERGILCTLRALITNPGQNVRQFITENRTRLVKPIIFAIITSLIYSVVSHFFHIEQGYISFKEDSKSTVGLIFKWAQAHYGYANIIVGVFIAAWLKLFFIKKGYNFFEILILMCFVIGISMLIFPLFALIEGLTRFGLMQIAGVIGLAYGSWAIGHFFDKKIRLGILKPWCLIYLACLHFCLRPLALEP